MGRVGIVVFLGALVSLPVHAQSGRFGPDDVATPRALTLALHAWASTTADQSLVTEDLFFLMDRDAAAVFLGDIQSDGSPRRRLLRDWFEGLERVEPEGWLETVLDVHVEQHGNAANAWARYEVRNTADGPVIRRGMTNLQLFHDGARWWGLGWVDVPMSDEPPGPLPGEVGRAPVAGAPLALTVSEAMGEELRFDYGDGFEMDVTIHPDTITWRELREDAVAETDPTTTIKLDDHRVLTSWTEDSGQYVVMYADFLGGQTSFCGRMPETGAGEEFCGSGTISDR